MSSFKKGDLVQHVNGQIAEFRDKSYEGQHDELFYLVTVRGDVVGCSGTLWKPSNCRHAPDYTKLVEAAKNVVKFYKIYRQMDEWNINNTRKRRLKDLEQALADLDAQPEQEYNWLAMDSNGEVCVFLNKPEFGYDNFNGWCYGLEESEYDEVFEDRPDFMSPGQLWERKFITMCADGKTRFDIAAWNGYWWELVEDHGKRCENCKHYHLMGAGKWCRVKTHACTLCMMNGPEYGMEGCKYEPKVDK